MMSASSRKIRGFVFSLAWMILGGVTGWAGDAVALLSQGQSGLGWTFDNGQEFPGAKGSLTVTDSAEKGGTSVLRLAGDFSEGGVYVQMLREVTAGEVSAVVFKVKPSNTDRMTVRLIDETGQCHQTKPIALEADAWQDVRVEIGDLTGGEHWGGADDGAWHGGLTKMAVLLMNREGVAEPSVEFSEIRAESAR